MISLRGKVTFGVAVVVFCALLAFASRFYQVTLDWTRQNALEVAKDKTIRLGRWVPTDRPVFEESLRATFQEDVQGYHGAVLTADGRFDRRQTTRHFPEGDFSVPPGYLGHADPWREPFAMIVPGNRDETFAVAWYPLGHGSRLSGPVAGWTVAAVPMAEFKRRTAELRGNMGIRMASILVTVSVATFLLVGLWTRSLTLAAESAEQLSQGDLGMRQLAMPSGDGELRRLVGAFNTLLERLRQLHSAQQRFVADAAHELRTPLTILRGEIQVALRRDRDADRYRRVLRSNLDEVARLSRLTDNLLALARADAGEGLRDRHTLCLATLGRGVREKLRPIADQTGVRLEMEGPERAEVEGDEVALERVLVNLVENAVRHCESGDLVSIRVADASEFVTVEVQDEGAGIAAEHLPRLFDRFYRVDSARDRGSGGAGLGLAMVKALTELHGGRVTVRSEVGVGSTFTVTLPKRYYGSRTTR